MAMMQVLGTGINVEMSHESWDRLSKRMQEYDDMTEHIMGPQEESAWTKTFILVPIEEGYESAMVPFLCNMDSVRILGTFLQPDEYFTIEHHKEVPIAHDECFACSELQEYLSKIPEGWC